MNGEMCIREMKEHEQLVMIMNKSEMIYATVLLQNNLDLEPIAAVGDPSPRVTSSSRA